MSVLVIGRDGQLSESLLRAAPGLTAYGLDRVDLTRPEEAEAAVIAARPSLVINAAAHTAVDKAESEEDLAYAINATGAEALARGAAKVGAGIVQISTDYVFPGDKDGEWLEDDPVAPLGAYGRTKLAGERLVMAANPRACVIRTAWVYCDIGANFVKTMLRLADRDRLTVVADQRGKPTSAIDLAEALIAIAPRLETAPEGDPAWGVFHYSGAGTTHWAGFAEAVFAGALARGMIASAPEVAHIPTSDYPTPAARPVNSAMSCEKFERVFGVAPRPWPEALGRVLDLLKTG
ncbi:MAG: dTDP-4-dehydrorhamnose reductase [Rhodobacteraceae bacterium]|nr:dTDP-4-dehydrorhamnose reductase [Paracoccaceae bacterium]MBR26262.1 dTDP-4-dehydrorhamnose reductase [Paracoccaceae bacterium]MBR29585.1 dTDP-4-dehydrorhamnose reductase [Paracoccaceae bacterium]